jgi:hypothetical protein
MYKGLSIGETNPHVSFDTRDRLDYGPISRDTTHPFEHIEDARIAFMEMNDSLYALK